MPENTAMRTGRSSKDPHGSLHAGRPGGTFACALAGKTTIWKGENILQFGDWSREYSIANQKRNEQNNSVTYLFLIRYAFHPSVARSLKLFRVWLQKSIQTNKK